MTELKAYIDRQAERIAIGGGNKNVYGIIRIHIPLEVLRLIQGERYTHSIGLVECSH